MAEVVALGLDAGSTTVKLVGVGADGSLAWSRLAPTYPHLRRQTSEMLEAAKAELETTAKTLSNDIVESLLA